MGIYMRVNQLPSIYLMLLFDSRVDTLSIVKSLITSPVCASALNEIRHLKAPRRYASGSTCFADLPQQLPRCG